VIIQEICIGRYISRIEVAFPTCLEEFLESLIPLDSRRQRRDSREHIIKDDMELGRNVLGARVKHQRHQARVVGREPNKNTLSGAAVPFRDLLTVLKPRVKNIHRTPKDMSTGQTRARTGDAREQLFRRETNTRARQFVVYPHCILHR
jgi:hypothetical protein